MRRLAKTTQEHEKTAGRWSASRARRPRQKCAWQEYAGLTRGSNNSMDTYYAQAMVMHVAEEEHCQDVAPGH